MERSNTSSGRPQKGFVLEDGSHHVARVMPNGKPSSPSNGHGAMKIVIPGHPDKSVVKR
jgi:hypothetical protein